MPNRIRTLALAALPTLALLLSAAPAHAQSDVLLQLRSGSPAGDRLRVDSAGGVVAIGQIGVGIIPATGTGYRMMWHPFKAAFRAGQASATEWDDANIGFFSWAGGTNAKASQTYSFAFGNTVTATAQAAAVFGSSSNVSGSFGFSAGTGNNCNGIACIAMGNTSNADGSSATAIGYHATADADFSTAIGYRASTNGHAGAVIFADASITDSLQAGANNEFAVRAAGGFRFRSNATLTTGCNLPAGSGVFSCASSRTLKDHFVPVAGEDVLARVRTVPVNFWNYKDEAGNVRHMGPFAEDFRAAFGLGNDDKAIGLLDIDGVNFAAAKALEQRTADQDARIRALEAQVAELRALVQALAAPRQPTP